MADGSGFTVRGRVVGVRGPGGPRLCDVRKDQVIVGCCDRCGKVGEVDQAMWPLPYETESLVSTLQRQLLCVACLGKSVTLQLWPVAPYPDDRGPAFQRWR